MLCQQPPRPLTGNIYGREVCTRHVIWHCTNAAKVPGDLDAGGTLCTLYSTRWACGARGGAGRAGRAHRAVACRRAAECLEWNMSQSGVSSAPMKRLLYAHAAMCGVLDAGSRG